MCSFPLVLTKENYSLKYWTCYGRLYWFIFCQCFVPEASKCFSYHYSRLLIFPQIHFMIYQIIILLHEANTFFGPRNFLCVSASRQTLVLTARIFLKPSDDDTFILIYQASDLEKISSGSTCSFSQSLQLIADLFTNAINFHSISAHITRSNNGSENFNFRCGSLIKNSNHIHR